MKSNKSKSSRKHNNPAKSRRNAKVLSSAEVGAISKFRVPDQPSMKQFSKGSLKASDLEKYRIDQDFDEVSAEEVVMNVRVGRPQKDVYVRTHPDFEFNVYVIIHEGETYLVDPDIARKLGDESACVKRKLIPTIDRKGCVFIWPLAIPTGDGYCDEYYHAGLNAATKAKKDWVRVQADWGNKTYKVRKAANIPIQPLWPETEPKELIAKAFEDRVISDMNHEVIKNLQGR